MKLKKVFPLALAALSVVSLSGCVKKVQAGGDSVVQIRAYKAGYGVDWLHEAAKKYHEKYPNVSFDFVEESNIVGENAQQEIKIPKNNQIDLYFLNAPDVNAIIEKSYGALRSRTEVLLEPLQDIFTGKAVGLDGKEETETIESRFFGGFKELCTYYGSTPKWNGNMYTLPWAQGTTGLLVNKQVLDKYNIAVPLTSDEFIEAIETISDEGLKDSVYPYSWAGGNASGYWTYLWATWFAQYSGQEGFEDFMNCNPASGNIKKDGYEVYNDNGILESLKAMFDVLDLTYSSNGSASKTHTEAQTEFIRGKSAFMVDGDWVLNEMKKDYFDETKDIIMITAPVLSKIGEEIGITDAQLHQLIEMIEAHKTNAEIKAAIPGLDDTKIDRVVKARYIQHSEGASHSILIPSYADAKDAAKGFIKFLYSNEGCRIFRNNAYANLPLKYTVEADDTNTPFQQSLDKIRDTANPQVVSIAAPYNNVRTASQMYIFNNPAWQSPSTFKSILIDKSGKDPKISPEIIFEQECKYAKMNWGTNMSFVNFL